MTRGAKKRFDRQEALERAMELFWEKSFESVGLAELVERMGIGRQSLYDTFGSKEELFREALDHYVGTRLLRLRDLLQTPGSPLANVYRALDAYAPGEERGAGLGCMLVNTLAESAVLSEAVHDLLVAHAGELEAAFRAAFTAARDAGELEPGTDVRALARTMIALGCGLNLFGRVGAPEEMVRDVLRMQKRLIASYATGATAAR